MRISILRMIILGAVLLSPAAFTTRLVSGEPAPGLMAKITLLDGAIATMKFEGVGCTSSICSRTVLKSKTGDSAVSTRLDSIAAIKDVNGGDVLFILRDGKERRMSLLTDFRVLYLTNTKGASEKVDLTKVKMVEFLAP